MYWIIYSISNTAYFWENNPWRCIRASQVIHKRLEVQWKGHTRPVCLLMLLSSVTAGSQLSEPQRSDWGYCMHLCVDIDYVCILSHLSLNCDYLCPWMCVHSSVCPCLQLTLGACMFRRQSVRLHTDSDVVLFPASSSVFCRAPPPATSAGDHKCVLLTFLAAWGQKPTHLVTLSLHWLGRGD